MFLSSVLLTHVFDKKKKPKKKNLFSLNLTQRFFSRVLHKFLYCLIYLQWVLLHNLYSLLLTFENFDFFIVFHYICQYLDMFSYSLKWCMDPTLTFSIIIIWHMSCICYIYFQMLSRFLVLCSFYHIQKWISKTQKM